MPGQLNLTGSGGGATQLVANDTITEDQEFAFPETGGTVVTDDFTGDVEIDGSITTTGNVQLGPLQSGAANLAITTSGVAGGQALISLLSGSDIANECQSGIAFGGCAGNHRAFIYGGHTNSGETQLEFQTDDFAGGVPNPRTVMTLGADGNVFASGALTASDGLFTEETGINWRISSKPDGAGGSSAMYIGNARIATSTRSTIWLDPDNPDNFNDKNEYVGPELDIKESIRNMQAALYRLKAAVLIPDTTVDQLRLRILEALETITEEVDQ